MTVLPPGPVTFSVPLRIGPLNVTVTVEMCVLAVLPLPGEVDLNSTWANAVAAVTALTAAAVASANEKRFMGCSFRKFVNVPGARAERG